VFQFTHFGHVEYTDNVPVNKKKSRGPAGHQEVALLARVWHQDAGTDGGKEKMTGNYI